MFLTITFVLILSVPFLIVAVARQAMRDEHIVVLHWEKAGWFLLEREAAGRYLLISPLRVPGAVVSYSLRVLSLSLVVARRRVRAWVRIHIPSAVSLKA